MDQELNGAALDMQPEGESVARAAIVDTKNQWTCEECGTLNTKLNVSGGPSVDVEVTTQACSECGAVQSFDEEPGDRDAVEEIAGMALRGDITVEDIKAGLNQLAGGIATSDDIENAARNEEGLPPRDQELPLDFGPFNPDAAFKTICEKQAEIVELQADYDDKKEAASDAKKELDKANKALVNIIESLKKRRQQALNPSQPYLADVSTPNAAAAGMTGCRWEQDHPGQPCPVCTEARKKAMNPAVESEVHPEHEGHAAVAERARVQNVLEPLQRKLEGVNVFTLIEELQALSTEDLEALTSYANEPTPMPPNLIARCCMAEEPGTLFQVCKRCDRVLVELVGDAQALPVSAFVGLQCGKAPKVEETPAPAEAAAATTEPTRTIKRRNSKPKGKKNPEGERAKQAEEGRKAASKKDQPKKSKKASASKKGKR